MHTFLISTTGKFPLGWATKPSNPWMETWKPTGTGAVAGTTWLHSAFVGGSDQQTDIKT